uniref:Uncharacterized protein n=1 Tax=Tanacetum cinerariifolium TaxID=118510 RepID=A0A6L2JI26_TANCI|nr:hypothetical protein [Tanacetum cinerariifolium]
MICDLTHIKQQVGEGADEVHVDDVSTIGVAAEGTASVADDEVPDVVDEPSIPSPLPPTQPPPPSQDIPSTYQRVKKLERRNKAFKLKRLKKVGTTQRIETCDDTVMDDVSKHGRMIADMDEDVDVTLKDVAAVAKDVQDAEMEETGFKMDYVKGMTYDDIRPIFEKKFNSNVTFLLKTNEQIDVEDSKALKRLSESQEDKLYKLKSRKIKEGSSEGPELEAVRVLWCAYYHIYYNIIDFASREEISTYKKKVAIGYKNPLYLTRAQQVQPALYNSHEIIKTNHVSAIVHNSEDTLEIAEITRKKMNDKMKDPEYFGLRISRDESKSSQRADHNLKTNQSVDGVSSEYPRNACPMVFEIGQLKDQVQSRSNKIHELREKISRLTKKHSDADPIHDLKDLDSQKKELQAKVNALHDLNERWRAENKKVKRHYKELYD